MPEGYPVDAMASSRRVPIARTGASPSAARGPAMVAVPPRPGAATLQVSARGSRVSGPTGVRDRPGPAGRRRGGDACAAGAHADADPGQVRATQGLLQLQHHAAVVAVPDLLQCGSLAAAHPRPVAALRQLGVEEGRGGRGRARPDIAARMAGAVERPRLWRHGDCIELGERGPAVDHLYADGERGVAGEGDAGESANEEEE